MFLWNHFNIWALQKSLSIIQILKYFERGDTWEQHFPASFLSFLMISSYISKEVQKKGHLEKTGLFNEWIKVVVDKPLKDGKEKDAKRAMLCIFPPTVWPLWSYTKAKLLSSLVYQVLWEWIKGKIFLLMKMMTDKMCLKAIKAPRIWSSWQHGIGL